MTDRFRQPAQPNRFVVGGGAFTVSGGTVEKDIKRSVEKAMKQRLGLKGNQRLPADVAALVASASAAASSKALEIEVLQGAENAAREFTTGDVIGRFDAKAKLADQSLQVISKSSNVKNILKKRAEMLASKKSALETAGFSPEEAMQVLLADIAARGH
ncbi:MAG: hypothetical protein U9N79_09550 [Actinomycetota bacterium]|nr:hypothetical protein [Actinomycetota bacterium]